MPAIALPEPPLRDGVVALRGLQLTDVPEACQDPEIPRWTLVPSPYGEDDARAYIQLMDERRAAGRAVALAIVGAADEHALLGSIALNPIDWDLRAADVGYWLAAPARGRGCATRALALLAGWAFGTLELERLELRAQEENVASHAVATRAGFDPAPAPVVARPECDHLPDVYFARLR